MVAESHIDYQMSDCLRLHLIPAPPTSDPWPLTSIILACTVFGAIVHK
jgi:hypothetical protein